MRERRRVPLDAADRARAKMGWPSKVCNRYLRTCRGVAEAVLMHCPPPLREMWVMFVRVRAVKSGYTEAAHFGVSGGC